MDDLISGFDSMNTWDSEKNYIDLINSIENARCILETDSPTFESIVSYIEYASNRYIYMNKFISFDDIKEKLQDFFHCSNGLEKIRISYDIDMYLYNYIH
jgi:Tat protein secretion system quality control protein TatD with DNase activity